jgi:hypothetical protein
MEPTPQHHFQGDSNKAIVPGFMVRRQCRHALTVFNDSHLRLGCNTTQLTADTPCGSSYCSITRSGTSLLLSQR